MKTIAKYLFIGILSCGFLSSCTDDSLETKPTSSMSGDGLLGNASSALVPLNGIYRSMYSAGWSTSGNTHQCFGISAYNLMADVMGEDMIMNDMGSGWFWYDCVYDVKSFYTSKAWRSYDLWNAYYTWVSNANYIIAAEETMSGTSADINYVIGQAYAIRAYSYFMLAQSFARTYKGHEAEPCCPIYTEPTSAGTQGAARSSVEEVYTQIVSDINKAVEKLNGTERKHISHISYEVALGIKARVALTMENWADAETAAVAAINAAAAEGIGIAEVEDFAGVNDVTAENVMWGAEIISDQAGMYASFFNHMDADMESYGGSARKQINKELYAKMGAADARLAWWNPYDSNNEAGGYQQEKFKFSDYKTWLGDYIWMRAEEMYLTAAEAACMQGNEPDAVTYLTMFMNYRDPNYACTKTGTDMGRTSSDETGSLREEIVNQRRIELWGEYGRIYDLRRLKQGFRRTAAQGWPASALLSNRPTDNPESYMWVLSIPQSEFDGNINMDPAVDQNPMGDE